MKLRDLNKIQPNIAQINIKIKLSDVIDKWRILKIAREKHTRQSGTFSAGTS
jgi:hypothetical protein